MTVAVVAALLPGLLATPLGTEFVPKLTRMTSPLFGHLLADTAGGRIERLHLFAMNLLIHDALAGGGPESPRFDPLGKGNGQILLDWSSRCRRRWSRRFDTTAVVPAM